MPLDISSFSEEMWLITNIVIYSNGIW
jgi:hypothetical protein